MHDSLPKVRFESCLETFELSSFPLQGNVEEILGNVPPYVPRPVGLETEFPTFEEGPEHPYHFIVMSACLSLFEVMLIS